jgi:hypothetical protein
VGADDDAADAVAVAIEVLRRAVDDEVCAQLERTLNARTCKRVVDHDACAACVRDVSGGRDVGEAHDRIGRRLEEQHLGLRPHGLLDELQPRRVDVAEGHSIVGKDLVEQPERSAVRVVGDDDVVPGPKQCPERTDGRHP